MNEEKEQIEALAILHRVSGGSQETFDPNSVDIIVGLVAASKEVVRTEHLASAFEDAQKLIKFCSGIMKNFMDSQLSPEEISEKQPKAELREILIGHETRQARSLILEVREVNKDKGDFASVTGEIDAVQLQRAKPRQARQFLYEQFHALNSRLNKIIIDNRKRQN